MKSLVIAEKYLAACDMAKVLGCTEKKDGYIEGNNYIVTWADGHLIGFQYPEEYNPEYKEWHMKNLPLNFDPEKNLKVLEGKEKQFEIVKQLIQGKETDLIINAGDAGREGYLLQYWIYKMAGNKKPVKVLWASSLTPEALTEAFTNLHDDSEFEYVLEEAKTRAEMDYILGMNYSRLLTLKCSMDKTTLPYGRCMTTLLNLIVQREKEIAVFQPQTTYGIEVKYKEGFKGTLIDPEGPALAFDSKYDAEAVVKELRKGVPEDTDAISIPGILCEAKVTEIQEKASLLYNLPDLQGEMGRKYKYAPAKTLAILQTLYEKHKIITYPRTDSNFLTSDLQMSIDRNLECCRFGKFRAALERCEKVSPPDAMYFDDTQVTDHHALIPAENRNMGKIYSGLSEEEKNVFDEIVYSFLGLFAKERKRKSATVKIIVEGYLFRSTESMETEAGYKLLRRVEEESDGWNPFYDDLQEQKTVTVTEIDIKEKNSNPPARYTYGTIIDLMQAYHIGTPATMAATIEKLLDPKTPLLTEKNGKYYSTPFGRMYISVIPEQLKDPTLTDQMEFKLSQVRNGKLRREDVIAEIMADLQNNIQIEDFQKKNFGRCKNVKKPSRTNFKKRRNIE